MRDAALVLAAAMAFNAAAAYKAWRYIRQLEREVAVLRTLLNGQAQSQELWHESRFANGVGKLQVRLRSPGGVAVGSRPEAVQADTALEKCG
ncbi:MAG TPA: hypothetical protein VLT90_01200 [Terriglobales bacterium]|nr:hypothetical protein [Terriglobales bacterium]